MSQAILDKVNRIFVSEAGDYLIRLNYGYVTGNRMKSSEPGYATGCYRQKMLQTEDVTDRRFYRRDCILDIVYKNESEYL